LGTYISMPGVALSAWLYPRRRGQVGVDGGAGLPREFLSGSEALTGAKKLNRGMRIEQDESIPSENRRLRFEFLCFDRVHERHQTQWSRNPLLHRTFDFRSSTFTVLPQVQPSLQTTP